MHGKEEPLRELNDLRKTNEKHVQAMKPPDRGRQDFLSGGGEMGALIRSMDWSATSLGPRGAWPESLRTVVNLILAGSFPMAILWGSDLICIYNDAYRVIAGDRHPNAMGGPRERTGRKSGTSTNPSLKG